MRRSSTASRATPTCSSIGNVVSRGNPLMEAILDARPARTSRDRSGCTRTCSHDRWVLAVAGTHGKTTTTAMLAWILEDAGLEPGIPDRRRADGLSACRRASPTARSSSIEADEYDTAFFDKRSKFVHYRPRTAILNNLEYDHADIFPDLAAIETQFHHLVRMVPPHGRIVANGGDACDRARAGARLLERGRALRPRRSRRTTARDGPSRWTARSCSAARAQGTLASRPARPPQPAERAGRARGRAPRRRARAAWARRACARSRACARRHGGARPGARHHRLRRLRAPPDRDRRDARGAAAQGRVVAHRRRAGAALEHDEARRDEGRAARQPRATRTACSATTRTSAGTSRARSRRWALRPPCSSDLPALVQAIAREAQAGRSRARDEQRRLRRHPRQVARARSPHDGTPCVYLHGFRSSPASIKATRLRA